MKIGIIGAGLIGAERADALLKLSKFTSGKIMLTKVVDVDSKALKSIHEKFGIQVSNDVMSIFNEKLDWIFICTPHIFIKPLVLKCFEHGFHVLVEKPLGRSLLECDEILGKKPEHINLMVGFNYRFFNGVEAMLTDLRNKKFGKLISVNMVLGHGNSPGMENSWKLNKEQCGGGCLIDPGIHLIDLARIISNSSLLRFRGGSSWAGFWKTGIEEEAHILLSNDNNVIFNLQISLNRWRSSFFVEVNGEDGYGILEGRGRSYGLQSYKTGRRWAWMGGINQAESETLVVEPYLADDSFLKETASILDIKNVTDFSSPESFQNPCNYLEARENMNILNMCQLGLTITPVS